MPAHAFDGARASRRAAPLWLAVGLAGGLLLSPLPAATQSGVSPEEVAALTKRLEVLEARLAGEGAVPAEGGLVLRAPFTVLDDKGRPAFSVEAEGGVVEVVVGTPDGVGVAMTVTGSDGATLEVAGGIDRGVELGAGPVGSLVTVANGSADEIKLGWLDLGSVGLEMTAGDKTVLEATTDAEGTALTVGAEGSSQAKLEGGGDEAALTLGTGEAAQVTLTGRTDGGELLLGKAEAPLAKLSSDADSGELALGGSAATATLTGKADAGTLLLGKEGGKLARLTNEGEGGALALGKGGEPVVLLKTAAEGGALTFGSGEPTVSLTSVANGGRLVLGEPEGLRVQIGITGADAVVQVADGDKRAALVAGGQMTGAAVATEDGDIVVGKGQASWGITLAKQGQPLAVIGTLQQDKPGLRLYEGGQATVTLKAEGGEGHLILGPGEAKVRMESTADGGQLIFGPGEEGLVALGSNPDGGVLQMGKAEALQVALGTLGGAAVVQAGDGETRSYLVASKEEQGFFSLSSEGQVELGVNSAGWGLLLAKDGEALANLGTYDGRAVALRMFTGGTQIAAVGVNPSTGGGTVRVFPPDGGMTAAALEAEPGGGLVIAYGPGGVTTAVMSSEEHAIVLYNKAGVPVASFSLSSSGSGGNVTTRDGAGSGVFSAGAASDGGGEACVNRQNGKTHCLGIGLPGMGTGN